MAEKKTKRVKDIMPYVILVFVLISTVFILVEVTGHLINEGLINTDQAPPISEPSAIPGTNTPDRPTPTAQPVEGA
jgi:hypothetical protein